MIYSSIEFRFFYHEAPQELKTWFRDQPLARAFPARTDQYLVFPESTYAGVKFREGRFEIKSFVRITGEVVYTDKTVPVEAWEKWSSPDLFGNIALE
jgi:hypothetical protein